MTANDDRKMLTAKALEKMRWTISNVSADQYDHQLSPLDKNEFVRLLKANFTRLDRDRNKGISKEEILEALIGLQDLKPDEHVMLQLLLRYFDFISDLVDDGDKGIKVISKQDVEVLSQFLLNSDQTLEALYIWCSGGSKEKPLFTPPPLSRDDSKG